MAQTAKGAAGGDAKVNQAEGWVAGSKLNHKLSCNVQSKLKQLKSNLWTNSKTKTKT